ncbi:hypothetical protein [Danxiaibacter flavus]|uniref:hypothetical protein n=1 Tax=Danxiaibacter flavus TaxID=3049108 RepID=UPI0034E05A3F
MNKIIKVFFVLPTILLGCKSRNVQTECNMLSEKVCNYYGQLLNKGYSKEYAQAACDSMLISDSRLYRIWVEKMGRLESELPYTKETYDSVKVFIHTLSGSLERICPEYIYK